MDEVTNAIKNKGLGIVVEYRKLAPLILKELIYLQRGIRKKYCFWKGRFKQIQDVYINARKSTAIKIWMQHGEEIDNRQPDTVMVTGH